MIKRLFKSLLVSFLLLANLYSTCYADFYVIPVAKSPIISIADVTMLEGNYRGGLAVDFEFSVVLGRHSAKDVTVTYTTSDGTASSASDYTTTSGTLTITAGNSVGTISVPVTPDITDEVDETFSMNLSTPSGATLGRSVATATIVNDDMRYTKIDSNGQINAFANQSDNYETTPWSCVTDATTGLMWETKTPGGDGGLRDANYTYTWYNSDSATNGGDSGTANGGTCGDTGNCDTEKYVASINDVGLCGYHDWRMPLLTELESIIDSDVSIPRINTAYFPHTIISHYWPASSYAYNSNSAWLVDFYHGYSGSSFKYNSKYVRLVRTGQ